MEEIKMDCKGCDREMTVYEEIDALPIEEKLKNRIMKKLILLVNTNDKLIKEIRDANSEINSLQRAVLYLSKIVSE